MALLIIDTDGWLEPYGAVAEAEAALELEDVAHGEFEACDADGRLYEMPVDENGFHICPTDTVDPGRALSYLTRYGAHFGVADDQVAVLLSNQADISAVVKSIHDISASRRRKLWFPPICRAR